ncbi:hypothetical protein N9V92_06785 [Luminiphilus sp.]|nr:hypothetical protein [Luminiphilus sp.]MDB2352878.1 hypothetical protein [Luminiphilus sp.]
MKTSKKIFVGAACLMFAGSAFSASSVDLYTVTGIVNDATRYNGCLLKVSPGPETIHPGCTPGFVTLGCDGAAGPSKSAAALNLSAAQLGFVTDTKVYIRVYDVAPDGNAYCLADRVDNTKIPR